MSAWQNGFPFWIMALWGGVLLFLTSACATVSTPVLRHETGETLGAPGKLKAQIRFETSRLFPVVPPDSLAIGTEQNAGIFKSSLFGFQGTIAAHQRVDFQIAGAIFSRGGGWRIGGKYALMKKGNLAVASTLGYGVYSSSGTETYLTAGQPVDVGQTLTVSTIDIAFPVSYRLTPTIIAYGGAMFLFNSVEGAASLVAVTGKPVDFGINLGGRLSLGRFELDLEMAFLYLGDNFMDSTRIIPYFGLGAGVLF